MYPRTGYVEPPREDYPEGRTMVTLQSAWAVSAKQNVTSFRMGIIYLFLIAPNMLELIQNRWELAVGMLALGTIVYWTRQWSERPYAWWSVLPLAISGIPFSVFNVPWLAQSIGPVLLGGLWLFSLGGCRLICYLRTNPKA